jgi:hypothetical protein
VAFRLGCGFRDSAEVGGQEGEVRHSLPGVRSTVGTH